MRFSVWSLIAIVILTCLSAFWVGGCADEAAYQRQRDQAIQERDTANKTALDAESALKAAQAAIAELNVSKLALQKESASRSADLDAQVARLQIQIQALEAGSSERTKAEGLAVELQRLIANQKEKSESASSAIDQEITKARAAANTATAAAAEAKGKASAIEERVKLADQQASADSSASITAITSVVGALWPGAAALSPIILGGVYKLARNQKAIGILQGKANAGTRVVQSIDALAEISPAVKEALDKYAPVLDKVQQADGKAFVDAAQGRATPAAS